MTLKQLHESLQDLYRRLQEERDALKRRLRQEQAEQDDSTRRAQAELARLREQLRAKCRECEELQHHALSNQDFTRLQRRLEDDWREAELEPIRRHLEGQIAEAQGRARSMHRDLEQERAKMLMLEADLKDKLEVETKANRAKEQVLERSKAQVEAERRKAEDLEAEVLRLEYQMEDQETRLHSLREQVQERELQSQREQRVWKQELDRKVADEQQARREVQRYRQLYDQEALEKSKQLQAFEAQGEELGAQQRRANDADVQAKAARLELEQETRCLHEEMSKQRAAAQEEQMKHQKELKACEEKVQAAEMNTKALEVKHQQLDQEKLENMQEREEAHEQEKARLHAENAQLRAQLEKSDSQAETRRQHWQAKEAELLKQVDLAAEKLETFSEELTHCKVSQQDCERRLKEAHGAAAAREEQFKAQLRDLDSEAAKMKGKVSRHEQELQDQARLAQDHLQKLHVSEQQFRDLKDEFLSLTSRQDQERQDWRKQLDEAQATIVSTEQSCSERLQALAEDQKKQLQALSSKQKRSLSKAKALLQEKQGKNKDLSKQVSQLQSEKAVAVRVCEENKRFFELRLAECSAATSPQVWRDFSPDMRELLERHEEHERQLRQLRG